MPLAALAVAGLAALTTACGGPGGDGPSAAVEASRSSTIALSPDGGALWLTSPDDDQVVEVDPETLEVERRITVDGEPAELTWAGERLVVTGAQRTSVAVLEVRGAADDAAVTTIEVPCGGTRAVASAQADGRYLAFVTCPHDDVVAVVDLDAGQAAATVSLSGRPTGIVRSGDDLSVSTAGDGRIHTWSVRELVAGLGPAPAVGQALPALAAPSGAVSEAWADGERSVSGLGSLDAGPKGVLGTYQLVDNLRKLSPEELDSDATYGSPIEGRARLEPALFGPCGARFSELTGPPRRLSGPVALAAGPDDLVWVVGQFDRRVAVVRCAGGGASSHSPIVASFAVGDGPRGIALDHSGQLAFVDVGFDHAVAPIRLPGGPAEPDREAATAVIEPDDVGRRAVDGRLSPLAEAGRSMFHDATDEHLTPFGVVTCASCHPAAGDDALSWRIETTEIPAKVRRTQALWGTAEGTPLHWTGDFTLVDALVLDTIQELLGGDGLLVDTRAIAAYLAESRPPPGAAPRTATDTRAVAAGAAVFERSCATCHAGPRGSDGQRHDVLAPSSDAAARMDQVVTPMLTAVRGRAPYAHDGRAATLEELLAGHDDGAGAPIELSDRELAALLAYLRTR